MSKIEYTGKTKRTLQKILFLRRKQRKVLKHIKKLKRKPRKAHDKPSEYTSMVLKSMAQTAMSSKNRYSTGMAELKVPDEFCFSRNPDEAIEFINRVYACATNTSISELHFDHTNCEVMGVCASTIMDIILLQCKKWRDSIKKPITYSGNLLRDGRISKNTEVDRLLKASGILKHLNVYDKPIDAVECLSLIKNGASSFVAESAIDYINRSLARHNLVLTPEGANYFGQLLGEISDNCSQHGGNEAVWYTLGHYSFNKNTSEGKCQLVILDFGNTIYEGLKNTATNSMKKKIDKYVRKSWSLFPKRDSEETLYTLFSLQQRVSRFEQKGAVRGNGTITFIDAFQNLFNDESSAKRSMLSITSGRCSILFDGTYTLQEEVYPTGYRNKTIAFNKENKLNVPPDKKYVRTLKNKFPGTIISMELYINNALIGRKENNNG
jgi:hypothetical protein